MCVALCVSFGRYACITWVLYVVVSLCILYVFMYAFVLMYLCMCASVASYVFIPVVSPFVISCVYV